LEIGSRAAHHDDRWHAPLSPWSSYFMAAPLYSITV
jgi:hypothetical protein